MPLGFNTATERRGRLAGQEGGHELGAAHPGVNAEAIKQGVEARRIAADQCREAFERDSSANAS